MRKLFSALFFLPFALSAVLFDGTFNSMTSSSDFDKWSFSNLQGEWKTYICGGRCEGTFSQYATLDPTYRNYADGGVKQGCRLKINATSTWNGGPMLRTEMIPNGWKVDSSKILYFHFSMKQSTDNQIDGGAEHQLVFFEQHFADIKYGGNGGDKIWLWADTQGTGNLWSSTFTADTWFNFILMVDYPGTKIALWHSLNGDPLTQVVPPTAVNKVPVDDWHLGNLRLVQGTYPAGTEQVLFYSGIRVTDDLSLTTFSTGSPTPPPTPGSPPNTPVTPTTPGSPTPNTPNTPSVPSNCQIGEQNCPCTQGGACNPGLSCINSYCTDVSAVVEPASKSGSNQMNGTIAACIAIIVIAVVVVAVVLLALFIKIKFLKS